ncbi:MAG: lamin tail domain-containing protein, partial [Verrucomicrobiota bacterium]
VATQPGPSQDPAQPASWRAGSRLGGTPGTGEVLPDLAPVQVHEILAHTDPPQQDAVELFNPAAVEAPVGGWFLTDDPGLPAKYRIPPGTVIPPGGWLVIEESQFNAPAQGDRAFRLGSLGDEVYLFSAAADGSLTGYSDGFAFGATPNGVSLGRYTNSVGELRLVPQARPSLGAANSGPALPPVVLNEIFYFPGPAAAALVEIRNTTRLPVPLFDPAFPTNTWRLDGLDFQFPASVVLPPEGYAVVTEGNADLVRLLYAIPPGVPVFGPTPGLLQRDGERLELRRPDSPGWVTNNGVASVRVPWLEVDTVRYQDRAPWPAATSGQTSLERLPGGTYGDDPASWRASRGLPSPGTDNNGNRPPQVEAGPEAQLAATTFPVVVPAVGSATDDGLPLVPGALAYAWSQVGGPPGVVFSQPGAAATDILLPGQGTFRVRLTVSDGERATADDRLLTVGRPAGDQTLVALGSTWRYFDQGVDQGTAWRERAFNDAAWPAGRARLGYGGDGEVTVINGGPGTSRIPTAYFRLRFNVAQPASVTSLRLRVVRDDGVIVYLNGREVLRDSMPEAAVTFSTLATATIGGADETTPIERLVDPTLLVAGENVLAAEVHQVNATSSDLGFDLALIGAVQD